MASINIEGAGVGSAELVAENGNRLPIIPSKRSELERLFEDAPAGAFSLNRLWGRAIAAGRLYGLRLEGRWMHVGSPLGLSQAETALAEADRA